MSTADEMKLDEKKRLIHGFASLQLHLSVRTLADH